jgi:Transposase DDE domain group 1
MVSQRVCGLAPGYEDINDHEQLRRDPVFGILAGREKLDEPLAGKSTLNRMELGTGSGDRYKKITFWKDALDELLVTMFVESYPTAPDRTRSFLMWTPPICPCTANRKDASFTAVTVTTVTFRSPSSAVNTCCARVCGKPTATPHSAP